MLLYIVAFFKIWNVIYFLRLKGKIKIEITWEG